MVACWVAGVVCNEAASSVGQSGCEKVDLMVAWSVARPDESLAAQMDSTMAVRKVYRKVDGMAAQTVDVKAEMKAGRMDVYSVAMKACEKVAMWVSSAQAAEMVVESERYAVAHSGERMADMSAAPLAEMMDIVTVVLSADMMGTIEVAMMVEKLASRTANS
jgi:hypothetical protein